jgi:lactate dehydrogenase-like 2-hydroxyacid dehydrogenase
LSVAVMGDGPFAQVLAALAKAALVPLARPGFNAARPVSASLGVDRLAIWRTADVVVVCGPGAGSPSICITAADMALMKPSARILNLAGPAALAADILRNAVLLARIEHSEVVLADETAERDQLLLNRTRVAAEDLIASLGFGRNSWHPPHLLNTDILCESCC